MVDSTLFSFAIVATRKKLEESPALALRSVQHPEHLTQEVS